MGYKGNNRILCVFSTQPNKNAGFTLLELLITVAVLSILVALAAPSFREMMDRNAARAAANDLLSSVLVARSEAIKREQRVSLAKNGDWSSWQVFTDPDADGTFDAGEELILDHVSENPLTVSTKGTLGNFLSFNSRGRTILSKTDGLMIKKGNHARYVCFPGGRPMIFLPENEEVPCK